MSEYANATLGGFPLLASAPVGWTFSEGTHWHEETFDMHPADAKALMNKASTPTELVIDDKERKLTVKYIWAINEIPGDNPAIARVRVVDRRFWLPYYNFLGRFNMRRNVGFQRVGDNATPQLNPVVPDVWYWP